MLLLFESSAGFALFKVDEGKVKEAETKVRIIKWRSRAPAAAGTLLYACMAACRACRSCWP
jgi:hypothetical protein